MGGAHPTFLPDEALGYADFVIRGEGEHSLVELIECTEKETPALIRIRGLSDRDRDERKVHNHSRELGIWQDWTSTTQRSESLGKQPFINPWRCLPPILMTSTSTPVSCEEQEDFHSI